MQVVQEYRTPDALLTFVVGRCDDGDICLGFDGFAWHTHADILASLSGLSEDAAVGQFVNDLLTNRAIIAITRVGGRIRDVWIADTAEPDEYKPEGEVIEFRYWDGKSAV